MKNKLLNNFYKVKNPVTGFEELDLSTYGLYRLGLTDKEVENYIKARCMLPQYKKFKNTIKKFWERAGVNTMVIVDGKILMYRHDVLRYADKLFLGKETYFD
jgi:hypothetical protein